MSWALIAGFLKEFWKPLLIFAGILLLAFTLYIMYRGIQKRNEEIVQLKASILQIEATMKYLKASQESTERLLQGQREILDLIYAKEGEAEKHFLERVIEHEKIVTEYVDKPHDEAAAKAYWDSEQEIWNLIYGGAVQ